MYPADAVVGWMGSNNVGVLSDSYNRSVPPRVRRT